MNHGSTPLLRRWLVCAAGLLAGFVFSLHQTENNPLLPMIAYGNAVTYVGQKHAFAQITRRQTTALIRHLPAHDKQPVGKSGESVAVEVTPTAQLLFTDQTLSAHVAIIHATFTKSELNLMLSGAA